MIKTGTFQLKPIGDIWQMKAPVSYTTDAGLFVMVPTDFITDFRVGPDDFIDVLVLLDQGSELLTLCDWLYSAKPFERDACNQFFYEACRMLKVSFFTSRKLRKMLADGGLDSWLKSNLPQTDRVAGLMAQFPG